jgi:hypothetical protein
LNAASNSKEIPLLVKYFVGCNQRLTTVVVIVHTIEKRIFTVVTKPILETLHRLRPERQLNE